MQAMEQDKAEENYILGNYYFNGIGGVEQEQAKAVELFHVAADAGHLDAMVKLAFCYGCGMGTVKDEERAFDLYLQAGSQGHLNAIYHLARCYCEGAGVHRDLGKAVELYEQARTLGHYEATLFLARCYECGIGVIKCKKKAIDLYQQAADRGHWGGSFNLALCYQNGNLVEKDEKKAAELFEVGARADHPGSIYELGRCYRDGKGVSVNMLEARRLFRHGFLEVGHLQSLFAFAMTYLDNPLSDREKQLVDEILLHDTPAPTVCLDWAKWDGTQEKTDQATISAANKLFLDRVGSSNASFLLAHLLVSTLDPSNLRLARNLIQNESKQHKSHHILSKWVRILIDDLSEDEVWSNVQLPRDKEFGTPDDIVPIALIGRGQFGMVYLSWCRRHDQYVAIKYIDIDLANQDELLARNALREQLTCRVLAARKVDRTAKYLGYTDLVSIRKRGLVFQLCADLSSLHHLTDQRTRNEIQRCSANVVNLERLPDWTCKVKSSLRSSVVFACSRSWGVSKVVTMLREAAEALLDLHKLGFIHRDVAPRNILCDERGTVQLADFGLAKYVGSCHDDASLLARYRKTYFTPGHQYALAWWAPECFGCEERGEYAVFSWNSDVYAFGITMWQCFAHDDPFSFVVTQEGQEQHAAKIIENLILQGRRPSLEKWGVLDFDTPREIIELIDSCWKTNPEDRPALSTVIQKLQLIENQFKHGSSSHCDRISFRGSVHLRWSDVSGLYKCKQPLENAKKSLLIGEIHGTYREMKYVKEMRELRHKVAPLDQFPAKITGKILPSACKPFDVFLAHAGERKLDTVYTMKHLLEEGNLHCFLDCEMRDGCSPTENMRNALKTCRYIVIVLSTEFFTKKHPAAELMYAFKRMKWIRKQDGDRAWDSLRVILYNMSVKEYQEGQISSTYPLPDELCKEVTVREWTNQSGKKTWWQECLELKVGLIEEDNRGAIEKWQNLLTRLALSEPEGFPSTAYLYH